MPPHGTQHLPALRVFLGPPDPEITEEEARYESILARVSDPQMRKRYEAEIARMRLDSILEQKRERELKQQLANAEAQFRRQQAEWEALRQQATERQESNERNLARLKEEQTKQAAEPVEL